LVLFLAGCGPEVKDKFGNSISKNTEDAKIGKTIFEQNAVIAIITYEMHLAQPLVGLKWT